jgi:uracil-DNA glycosylase
MRSMKLTFLGTRGNIDVRSRRHQRHTSTLISFRRDRVMIDCSADWLRRVDRVRPSAIVLTHAHSDHVEGLKHGAPLCPVKYRPTRRRPRPADVAHGRVHLLQQLDIIEPKIVVLLGSTACLGVMSLRVSKENNPPPMTQHRGEPAQCHRAQRA